METEQLLLPKLTSSINNKKQLRFGRTYGCSSALIIAEYWASKQQSLLVITPDVQSAESMEEQLNFFCRSICRITIFPDLETLPYDSFSPHSNLIAKRLLTLNQLLENNIDICIVAISTLSNRLPPKTYLYDRSFNFKTGEKVNPAKLKERLQKIGYQRVNQVNEHGEYAVRGSLIDIYSSGMDKPARLDFFDNEIDSIRYFDVENQLSDVHLEQLKILPAREFEITKDSISNFRNRFRERFDGNPSESLIYSEISDQRIPNGIESYLPLFHEKTNTLWDYLSKDFVVFSQGDLEATAEKVWLDIEQRHNELSHDLEKPMLSPEELFCSVKYHLSSLSDLPHIKLISNEIPIQVSNDEVLNLKVSTAPQIMINTRQKDPLRELINFIHSFDGRLLISAETTGRRELLIEMLKENKIIPYVLDNWNDFFHTESKVNIVVAPLENGLSIPDEKIFLITEQELFGSRPKRRKQKRVLDPFAIINDLNDLQIGAPVVHIDYGVGRYCGLSHLEINSIPGDFLTIEYAGGDRLHVPISSLQLISRYTGGAPENAPINRLGTDQWDRRKRKAAEQIRDTAVEMLDLYSSRAARQGYSWKMNPLEYDQFVSEFPFELTEDQSNAIEMTLSDLASNEPMDRLVCGDVGFGKTEVALRAAFVTAMAGGQVALLVPTTLLADQHYRNFYDRFADWPINVAVLSRFRSKKEAEKILEELESGKIDIVIGTHKLLQNDVKIKKLGLLIIDEEHRFGVRHKEKLKKFRTEVDILALTATPIPRTLNMAMGELRKLSIIATPPESRLAVKTFVAEWDNNLLRETCQRELKRGGQIYFVHNRVKGIDAEAKKLSQLIPEAKIRIAHGKMHERDLEQIMLEFYQRKFNILFCTSIIESGLDVPTANTIIINRADQFGLAQLHQLRGRVGRSHHKAFALLLTPPKQSMTEDARKRLSVIESMEQLGAGFVLATHDLEIRGAGELLGEKQTGQIQQIGFSLYMDMLNQAVESIRLGKSLDIEKTMALGPEVNMNLPALLPEEYLPDIQMRLVLYKRIASAKDKPALNALKVELIDRFGLLPEATHTLFMQTEIRLKAEKIGIKKLEVYQHGITLEFSKNSQISPEAIVLMIQDQQGYKLDTKQRLHLNLELISSEERFQGAKKLLGDLERNSSMMQSRNLASD